MSRTFDSLTSPNALSSNPLHDLLNLVRAALQTEFEPEVQERELSFTIPPHVPLTELLDQLEEGNFHKEFHNLRVTVIGARLRIRQCMPSVPHETASSIIFILQNQLRVLAGGAHPGVKFVGSGRYTSPNEAKEADGGLSPLSRPSTAWPSVVVEVGDSQTRPSLNRDVDEWFGMNLAGPHRVNLVITIQISRPSDEIVVTFFERAAVPNTDSPFLASPVHNLGPFTWTRNNIPNLAAMEIPVQLFYDTVPPLLAPHPTVTIPANIVQDLAADIFHGL
ncbi:hypothetical protein FB45DRAFT_39717 [Roridomyces roridus]|uniref:Uncharacterized protein n=1 Tax=Roridomyces roridus TaxID=1738132 RepID=A0AAD7FN26_9AGAR|nr:hypothetical protein FB45DRAFT_39717 [Roridomyces roridus]